MSRDKDAETTLFLGANNKLEELVDRLLKCPERKNYCLTIASCYFNCQSAKKLIEKIRGRIDCLKFRIKIYIDYRTAGVIGKPTLCNWENDLKSEGFNISVYISDWRNQSNLFHPKAYCLASCKEDWKNCAGSLVIGSANLTGRGLTKNNGNIELLLDTQCGEYIENFYKQIERLKFIEIENLGIDDFPASFNDKYINEFSELEDNVENEEDCFYYRLLSVGYLIHPWRINLSDYFKIVYRLKSKQDIKTKDKEENKLNKLLHNLNFTIKEGQKTITKDYSPDYVKSFKQRPSDFIGLKGKYGIETLLGYWIPKQIVDKCRRSDDKFNDFKKDVIFCLQEDLDTLGEQINKDWEELRGYIIGESQSPQKKDLFMELIKNEPLQKRIYERYGVCNLPYHVWQKQEVESLYISLKESCLNSSSNKMNKTQKAILKVLEDPERDLSPVTSLQVDEC